MCIEIIFIENIENVQKEKWCDGDRKRTWFEKSSNRIRLKTPKTVQQIKTCPEKIICRSCKKGAWRQEMQIVVSLLLFKGAGWWVGKVRGFLEPNCRECKTPSVVLEKFAWIHKDSTDAGSFPAFWSVGSNREWLLRQMLASRGSSWHAHCPPKRLCDSVLKYPCHQANRTASMGNYHCECFGRLVWVVLLLSGSSWARSRQVSS